MRLSLRPYALMISISLIVAAVPSVCEGQSTSRSMTVQEAIRTAITRAPEVLIAETQAARAKEAVRETRSLNRPQVYTGTGLAYNNGYPLSLEGAAPSIFQVGASQAIFSKKNSNLINEAEEAGKASRLGAEAVRNELASRTALVYYELFKSRRMIEIASERLQTAEQQQGLTETLLDGGRVLPVEVTKARTAVSSARQQLLIAKEQAAVAESELRALTGIPDSVSIETIEPRIESPIFELGSDALYRQVLESSPEVMQAEANLRAKEYHVEAEKGEAHPRAEIIGQYALFSKANNYDDFFNRFTRNNFIIGLSLQVPIFNGFRTNARVAQSRQEASEARHNLERIKANLKLRIERGLSALRIARGAAELAHSDAEAAREMLKVSTTLLESGRIGPGDLEEARGQLHQKELAILDAEQLLYQRKLELLSATGSISSLID